MLAPSGSQRAPMSATRAKPGDTTSARMRKQMAFNCKLEDALRELWVENVPLEAHWRVRSDGAILLMGDAARAVNHPGQEGVARRILDVCLLAMMSVPGKSKLLSALPVGHRQLWPTPPIRKKPAG